MANASAAPLHPLLSSIISTSTSSRCHSLLSVPPECVPIASNPSKVSVTTTAADSSLRKSPLVRRRDLVAGIALAAALTKEPPSVAAREVEVGSYLPPAPTDPAFVVFKATSKDTPALRAGNVQPYEFMLPPTWKQTRVANILSGNYCQPKCAEPWVEVKFEDEKQGKVQIVASPLVRLTNKPNATIEDIGSPEKVIASLGPFVTGNTFDSDELLEASIEKSGDQTYYKYELETPFALTGSHNLAKATAKGNTVILFVASASDKQWPLSEKVLKAMLESFKI
ncbi:psbP domain-containing protein 6, chloroplastic-like [Musa acuminata AAA Group]|uniref:psbP domain-containing protein 6, chloroplastic-like n=1 Tax=Musa acuminata AAA Group TaxID=214697 RepID=UPI0031DD8BAA